MAVPSALVRLSGPSGVATELMKTGRTGTEAMSPKIDCSGWTVPWSTSMLAESATSTPLSHNDSAHWVATSAGTLSAPP